MGAEEIWPLFRLRLETPSLLLRAAREADVCVLAAKLPDDLELDPTLPVHEGLPERQRRAVAELQQHWRRLGEWTADAWRLPFAVALDGQLVGVQTLEGVRFRLRRGVETASWLIADVRGRGGREMRAAVLHLAFEELGTRFAESGAWHDNYSSLGVSRSLGYEDDGYDIHVHGDRVDRMPRVILWRERWQEVARPPVTVAGLEACLPLFGLG